MEDMIRDGSIIELILLFFVLLAGINLFITIVYYAREFLYRFTKQLEESEKEGGVVGEIPLFAKVKKVNETVDKTMLHPNLKSYLVMYSLLTSPVILLWFAVIKVSNG